MPENTTLPTLPGSALSRAKVAVWTPEAPVANYQLSVSEIIAAGKAGIYPDARLYVPRGVTASGVIVPGSGGADGTYALTWSGGNFTANPVGTFKVTGGRVMAVTITQPGLYVGASPTAPTATFTNSAGLSGASVPLTVNFLVNSGDAYWADHASDGDLYQLVRNVNGTATEMAGRTLPKNTDPIAGDIATVAGLAATATTQAGIATTQAGIATTQANLAVGAKNDIIALGEFAGVYTTKALADAALSAGDIAVGDNILVQTDESQAGQSWRYQRVGAALVSKGVAINRGPVIVPRPALSGGGSGGIRVLDVLAPASTMNDSSGLSNSTKLTVSNNTGLTTNGPGGRTNYYNTTMRLGLNLSDGYQNENLSLAAVGIGFENLFYLPGVCFATETHLVTVTKDDRAEKRQISFVGPELASDWGAYSSITYRSAVQSFNDGEGNQRIIFDQRANVNQIQITRGTVGGVLQNAAQIAFQQNNRAPILLHNAAGSAFLEPFRLTSGDRLQFNIPRTEQITATATGILGLGTVNIERQFLGTAASSIGQYTTWAAVTGGFTPDSWAGGATGLLHFWRRNTTAAGTLGKTLVTNGGVSFVSFENSAGGSAGPQIRYDTASDTLQIHADGYRGGAATKAAMTMPRATGQVQFATAPKLPSSTVAALPVAATAGAGSQAYVTNLNSTTSGSVAAGGGTNKGVVVCDGTDWRIMTAW